MKTVQNLGTKTRTFIGAGIKVKCYPNQYAELPDGVADRWVKFFDCALVESDHKPAKPTPKRPRKKAAGVGSADELDDVEARV